MTDDYGLTKPERYAERVEGKRVRKRMDADRSKEGLCCLCKFRDTTFGKFHCKQWVDRQNGACQQDGKLPRFEFDPVTLEKYR